MGLYEDLTTGTTKISMNPDKLQASICRDSYIEFIKYFWDTIVTDELFMNWHMEYFANELQIIAERVMRKENKPYDLVGNMPPGSSKSSLASIFYPAWVWTRMPHAQFICTSYSYDLALLLSIKCRQVVNSDKYRRLFPEIEWSEEQNNKQMFINTRNGWRYAVGAGGTITGIHAHFIIIDDPLNAKKAVSDTEIATVNRWIKETLTTRVVNRGITPIILIMQRLHQADPSAMMLKRPKIKHIRIPATNEFRICPEELAVNYTKDGLLDPVRLPREALENARLHEMGQYAYAGQYGQDPIPLGGGMFLTEKIKKGFPHGQKLVKICRYNDKAATAGGGAYSVGAMLGKTDKKEYVILHVWRKQVDSATRENIIKSTAENDGRDVIVGIEQEPGSGGKESAENTVKNLAGWIVKVQIPRGDKTIRADCFSVQVNNGSVWMVEGDWNDDLIDELDHFPNSLYKDQTDALSGAMTVLNEPDLYVGPLRTG